MTCLRTSHRRQQRKTQHPTFPKAALRRFKIANRFAASIEGKRLYVARLSAAGLRHTYQSHFYEIKDRILARFGKHTGYALQEWYSGYQDWDDGHFVRDACRHRHVLACIKLRHHVFHRPTGAFDFENILTEYGKAGGNFTFYKTLCTSTIEGRKQVMQPPAVAEAKAALNWLEKRFGWLPKPDSRPRHEIPGTFEQKAFAQYEADRQAAHKAMLRANSARIAARLEAARRTAKFCVWCNQTKTEADFTTRRFTHNICDTCAPKAAGVADEIPF